jgi:anthranilate synthase component 2
MILIIDNYDSFTYNLVHLVAEHTSDYKVYRNNKLTIDQIRDMDPDMILLSPGPGRPDQAGIMEDVIESIGKDTPVLGVCLGHQAIGEVFGAEVVHAPTLMHGKTSEIYHDGKNVYHSVTQGFTATRYHSLVLNRESISDKEFEITAETSDGIVMGIRHRRYPIEGIQFHPESILTIEGPKIIKNWLNGNNNSN